MDKMLRQYEVISKELRALGKLQEPLKASKAPAPHSPEEATARCNKLVQWCFTALPVELQADLATKINVRRCDNPAEGHGVYASQAIGKHDLVLQVPRSLNISASTAKECPLVKLIAATYPAILTTPVMMLSLQLCTEAILGDKSKYAAYIDILPSEFSIPNFFPSSTLKLLK